MIVGQPIEKVGGFPGVAFSAELAKCFGCSAQFFDHPRPIAYRRAHIPQRGRQKTSDMMKFLGVDQA
jgi:hypothetical protein